jgi:hypothetical protein
MSAPARAITNGVLALAGIEARPSESAITLWPSASNLESTSVSQPASFPAAASSNSAGTKYVTRALEAGRRVVWSITTISIRGAEGSGSPERDSERLVCDARLVS